MSLELDLGAIVGTVVLDDVIFQRTYVRVVRQMADLGVEAERSGGQTLVLDRGLDGVGRSSDVAATRLARASAAMREAGFSASQTAEVTTALGLAESKLAQAELRGASSAQRLNAVRAAGTANADQLAAAVAELAKLQAADGVAEDKVAAATERVNALRVQGAAIAGRMAAAEATVIAANDRMTVSQERLTAAQGRGARMGAAIKSTWAEIPTVVKAGSLALILAAAASVHAASDYQKSTVNLVTGAGEQQSNLSMVSKGMLEMAGEVGDSAQELAKAMFTVESAGYHGAAGLTVLRTAAEGAKVDNADLTTVVDALTSALNAYDLPASAAARVTNELIAAASVGKMHLQDLAGALGTVLPEAAALHIPLDQVGAALATMTMQGTNAQQAATYLRFSLAALANPTEKAQRTMESLGLTSEQVADTLAKGGLPAVLTLLTDAVGRKFPVGSAKYVAALANMVGGTRGMQAVLELTGAHLETMDDNLAAIQLRTKLAGNQVSEWDDVQKNFNVTLSKFLDRIEANGIALGQHLLPVVTELFKILNGGLHVLGAVTGFLADNKTAAFALAGVVTVALLPGITRLTASLMTSAWGIATRGLQAIAAAATTAAVKEDEAAAATSRLGGAGSRLAKSVEIAGTLYGIYQGAKALQHVFDHETTPSVEALTAALIDMDDKGSVASKRVLANLEALAKVGMGAGANYIKTLDQALTNLVAEGHVQIANEDFDKLAAALKRGGESTADIRKQFPLLTAAMQDNENQAKLTAAGLDQVGDSAEAAAAKAAAAVQQTATEAAKASLSLAKFNQRLATEQAVQALAVHTYTAIRLYKNTGDAADQVLKQISGAITDSVKITATGTKEIAALLAAAQNKAANADFHALISHQAVLDATAYAKSLRAVAEQADSLASKAKRLADGMASESVADKLAKATAEATAAALAKRAKADDDAATAAEHAASRSSAAYKQMAQDATAATAQATAAARALVAHLQANEKALLAQVASFRKSVTSSLTGGTDLTSIWQSLVGTDANGNPTSPTLDQVKKTLDTTLTQVTGFTKDLTKIANEGGSKNLIDQILGLGDVDGDVFAKQLLAAGPSTVAAFSSVYAQLDKLTAAEGNRLAASFYGDGVSSMEQLIKGMISKFPDLKAALRPLISALQAAFTITPVIGDPAKGRVQASPVRSTGSPLVAGGLGGGKSRPPVVVTFPGSGTSLPVIGASDVRGGDGAAMVDVLQSIAASSQRIERQLATAPSATGEAVAAASLDGFRAAGKANAAKTSRNRRNNR